MDDKPNWLWERVFERLTEFDRGDLLMAYVEHVGGDPPGYDRHDMMVTVADHMDEEAAREFVGDDD